MNEKEIVGEVGYIEEGKRLSRINFGKMAIVWNCISVDQVSRGVL